MIPNKTRPPRHPPIPKLREATKFLRNASLTMNFSFDEQFVQRHRFCVVYLLPSLRSSISLRSPFSPNKHQMAQSKIEFCNYLNYLFARVHYQIVIMPNAFFVSRADLVMGVKISVSDKQHALFSLSKRD